MEIVKHKMGADPAAVAYDACEAAKARGIDVLIVDTAGRLHTQDHLMRELTKIRDVVAKRIPGAPHEVLLVLDATTGQNAINQAKDFSPGHRRHRHLPGQARRHRQGRRRRRHPRPAQHAGEVRRPGRNARRTSKPSIRSGSSRRCSAEK